MTEANKEPLTYDFIGGGGSSSSSRRPLVTNYGWRHTLGVNAFLGVEYYFLPKMCIGIEGGASMTADLKGRAKVQSERFVGDTYHKDWVDTYDVTPEVDFTVATKKPGQMFYGNFYFMFHF